MRAIDADATVKNFRKLLEECLERERNACDIKNKAYCRGRALALATVADLIDIAPTLDVQPVVHAEWVELDYGEFFKCSNCGKLTDYRLSNFCPDCGAKMDKEKSNEKADT